uniref:Uncharacterized protein LOC114330790 n=1 Tax=Diabrotica virgifera virgifera TaxID=50390 RepID=A0A6P7FT95_DIAVI
MASDWTSQEKHQLLKGLKKVGSKNMVELHKFVPTKTPAEIQLCCDEYAKGALRKLEVGYEGEEVPPIDEWLLILNRLKRANPGIHDVIPRVLKYIALYEKRGGEEKGAKKAVKSRNTIRQCYFALSNMCRGLTDAQPLNGDGLSLLYESLKKLGRHIKYNGESKQQYIRLKTNLDKENEKVDLAHDVLNPLGIPSSLTKLGNAEVVQIFGERNK